jgi:hypothetical protein
MKYYPLVLYPPILQDFMEAELVQGERQKGVISEADSQGNGQSVSPGNVLPNAAKSREHKGEISQGYSRGSWLLRQSRNPMLVAVFIPVTSVLVALVVVALFGDIRLAFFVFFATGLGGLVGTGFQLRKQQGGGIGREALGYGYTPSIVSTVVPVRKDCLGEKIRERQDKLKGLLYGKVMKSEVKSSAQQGVSEQDFWEVMRRFFPAVTFGYRFPIPGTDYAYSTDFQVIHETGVSIDIEVDEPYEGRTNQPHHCRDEGKDQRRNQFFLSGNWIVVRFAEIQVVKYPYECVAVIGEVLATVTGDETYRLPLRKPVQPVKCWTKAEARRMARSKFRQSYLPGCWTNHRRKRKRRR